MKAIGKPLGLGTAVMLCTLAIVTDSFGVDWATYALVCSAGGAVVVAEACGRSQQ